MQRLLDLTEKLRSPKGCPWDKKQTHQSLIPFLLEEAWEVIEEIKSEKLGPELKDELGDLLFQVVLHAQIAKEEGRFTFEEVVESVTEKMILRHPHVFGQEGQPPTDEDLSEEELTAQWNRLKKEKNQNRSVLEGIPHQGPQLLHAKKIGERAASLGFEFDQAEQILEKIHEETEEVKEELKSGDKDKLEMEIGDLLFAVTNLARFMGINPELALKRSNEKFKQRFTSVEAAIKSAEAEGKPLDLEQMERHWEQAKQNAKEQTKERTDPKPSEAPKENP